MTPGASVVVFLLLTGLCMGEARYDTEEEGLRAMEEQAEEEVVKNIRLYFHRINSFYQVGHSTQCAQLCRLTPDCKSYQYRQVDELCEINNATLREFREDYKSLNGWRYYRRNAILFFGIWNPCNQGSDPCRNGGICTPLLLKTPQTLPNHCRPICVCPAGFQGDNCEMDIGPKQDNLLGWTQHGSSFFKVVTNPHKTYSEARVACAEEGATLALVKDQETHDFVLSLRNMQTTNIKIYIGLNDLENEGTFVWEDGSPLGGFNQWLTGQPNDENNNQPEDCAAIYKKSGPHQQWWGDIDCNLWKGYVCQKRMHDWSPVTVKVIGSSGAPWADNAMYTADSTLDGNNGTYWHPTGFDRHYNNWYVIYDMGSNRTLSNINLTNYGDTVHDIKTFKLQTSVGDKLFDWTGVLTVTDVLAGTTDAQEFAGFRETSRYWRLLITETYSGWPPFLVETAFSGMATEKERGFQTCQTMDTESGGEVRNPLYPQPSSFSCEALVTVGRLQHVELTFTGPFSVENHRDCAFDYVELFEYVGGEWKSLGKFCGPSRPDWAIRLTGNAVKVVFHADDSVPSLFSVAWQPKDEEIRCPRLTAPTNGNMTTGNTNSSRDVVQFTCHTGFRLEGAPNVTCQSDGQWSSEAPDCAYCLEALGMEARTIPDNSITASSNYQGDSRSPHYARLHKVLGGWGAWIAGRNVAGQWLQVDLGGTAVVSGVSTQGRSTHRQWVKSYKLQFSWSQDSWTTYTDVDGSDKVFIGNSDWSTPVTNILRSAVSTRYIRFVAQTWHNHICLRVEVLGCHNPACDSPLGMESGHILDDRITASSVHHSCRTAWARLNSQSGWCAETNRAGEWLQIDLGLAAVSGVITQSRGGQWVRSYKLMFSRDGGTWTTYQNSGGSDKVFTGNSNTNPVTQVLDPPVTTRYIRIVVQTWKSHISMRVEVLGCYNVDKRDFYELL